MNPNSASRNQKMLQQSRSILQNLGNSSSICTRCLYRLSRTSNGPLKRPFHASTPRHERSAAPSQPIRRKLFRRGYFSANSIGLVSSSVLHQTSSAYEQSSQPLSLDIPATATSTQWVDKLPSPSTNDILPHRRRRRSRDALPDTSNSNPAETPTPAIPPDASSLLTTLATSTRSSLRRRLTTYLSLSKPRLTFLIVLTTASAYSLYPVPTLLLPETTSSPSLSALTLLSLTTGTALCSASANALNMLLEPLHDAKMSRTRNRPLVRGLISKRSALIFALVTGALGISGLSLGVNPTVSFLGALNIALYAGVYTPLKRISVLNTWVGAVVGGIPPLMGWAAAAGQSAPETSSWRDLLFTGPHSEGGWLLAGLLFAWQFPHFNALSWTIRHEYRAAGYRMLAWVNPAMNARVALRYSLLFFPICAGLWWCGITDAGFLVTSSAANAWLVREAWRFWRFEGARGSARGLFWAGVWHLPVVMVLAMAHKKGLWAGVWRSINGEEEEGWEGEEVGDDNAEAPLERMVPEAKAVS